MSDLKNLRDLTLACLKEGIDWYSHDDLVIGKVSSFDHDFVTAFAPVVVLGLLDQLEAAQKDAARYQWVRSTYSDDGIEFWPDAVAFADTAEKLDAAIDAAMTSKS